MNDSKAMYERKHVWRNEFLLIISLIVFVGLVYTLDAALQPVFTASSLLLAGVFMAVVPAAIWLVFFYLQDRAEPEPKGYVAGVFLLGALLAGAVGVPLVENFFRISHWIHAGTLTTLAGGILVVGFTQEFLKYAAVRYSIYHSDEFDEPTDGVIYATAAGLGYATVLNIQFVVSNGGVDLGTGVISMAVVALAQASFSGITGYFLGRAKFESEQVWWMPLGITLAAVFNGVFNWLRGLVIQSGVTLNGPSSNVWPGLVLAAGVAFATSAAVLWLVRRNMRSANASAGRSLGDHYAEITVIALTVIALAAGWFFKAGVETASVPFSADGISAQAPQGWRQSEPAGDELLRATDRSSSGFSTTYVLRNIPIAPDVTGAQVSSLLALKYGQELNAFRMLEQREVTVFGKPAYEIQYVFVESNPNLTSKNLPSVVLGTDYIFLNADHAVVASYWADEEKYELDLDCFLLFLESIEF